MLKTLSLKPHPLHLAGLGLVSGVLAIAPAMAQETGTPNNFIVGGAAGLPEFEGSDDLQPVPLVIGNFGLWGARVELEGLRANADIIDDPLWRAGPALGLVLPRGDDVEADAVAELEEVDVAVELGGFIGFETPFGSLPEGRLSGDITVRQDVADAHNGFVATADIDYFFAAARVLRFSFGANASFASDDYMDTYFSVDAEDATASGLSQFDASGGLKDVGVEVNTILSFSPRNAVFVRAAYNRLLGDAADSSIVTEAGSEDQFFIGAGLFYAF